MKPVVERHQVDVLVIGGGLAGTTAAARAREAAPDLDVLLVDKASVGFSGQSVFVASIWAAFQPDEDSFDDWLDEVLVRGEFLADQDWVVQYLDRSPGLSERFCAWGESAGKTIFERDEDGRFVRRKSRGHVKTWHYVYHAIEGMQTMRARCEALGVRVLNRTMVFALLCHDGRVAGAVALGVREGTVYVLEARTTILASSGSGFKSIFVGHRNLTGDLQAEAFRQGAELVSMEKWHGNTCARDQDIHGLNLFLGSGGKLINRNGEEFMWRYSPLGNRARLQDLTLGLSREVFDGRGPIYMDMRGVSPRDQELMRRVLGETFRTWDAAGVRPFEEPMEWVTSWTGTRESGGGIRINRNCETNLTGLYAAGDITDIPVNGTSTVGGMPISFCLVSGTVAGEQAVRAARELPVLDQRLLRESEGQAIERLQRPLDRSDGYDPRDVFLAAQQVMIRDVGFVKNRDILDRAVAALADVRDMATRVRADDYHELMVALEAENQAILAELMLEAARMRTESRGGHFRLDYPFSDNENWLKCIVCRQQDGRAVYRTVDVPQTYFRPATPRHRPPGLREDEARASGLREPECVRKAAPSA